MKTEEFYLEEITEDSDIEETIKPILNSKEIQEIVVAHIKAIRWEAMRFLGKGHDLTLDDLFQSGVIGAIKAAKHFDPARNYKFYTYASHWVRRAIITAIIWEGARIRLSTHVHDDASRLQVCKKELGEKATLGELQEMSDLAPETIQNTLRAKNIRVVSLQRRIRGIESSRRTLEDTIPDHSITDPELHYMNVEKEQSVRESLEVLSQSDPVASKILKLRFGISDGNGMSVAEIGKRMGLTRERIKQLSERGMREFRKIYERKNLKKTDSD